MPPAFAGRGWVEKSDNLPSSFAAAPRVSGRPSEDPPSRNRFPKFLVRSGCWPRRLSSATTPPHENQMVEIYTTGTPRQTGSGLITQKEINKKKDRQNNTRQTGSGAREINSDYPDRGVQTRHPI